MSWYWCTLLVQGESPSSTEKGYGVSELAPVPGLELFPEAGSIGIWKEGLEQGHSPHSLVYRAPSFPCPSYLQKKQGLLFCPLSSGTGCSFALQGTKAGEGRAPWPLRRKALTPEVSPQCLPWRAHSSLCTCLCVAQSSACLQASLYLCQGS